MTATAEHLPKFQIRRPLVIVSQLGCHAERLAKDLLSRSHLLILVKRKTRFFVAYSSE
jgi:hypothetical protein